MTEDGDTPNKYGGKDRNAKGQFFRTLHKAERDAECARLYSEGGWTFRALAEHLGYSDHSAAIRGYQRAIREAVRDAGEQALRVTIDRLEYLWEKAVEVLEKDHVVVSHGKVIEDVAGRPLIDSGPTLAAIREARATLERLSRIAGLEQPTKLDLSGGVTYQVVGVDPEDLT